MSDLEPSKEPCISPRNDRRSTSELIAAALLALEDGEGDWNIVSALQLRGSLEVFEAARELCHSLNFLERRLGVQILGQLGTPELPFVDRAIEIFLDLLFRETHPQVLMALAISCGHCSARQAILQLIALKNHVSADVRFGVVCGLPSCEDERVIQPLIELSADDDWEVRNWATFGLGSLLEEFDTEAIRDALWKRIEEEKGGIKNEIYGEALVGLAVRKDDRAIPLILQALNYDGLPVLAINAAERWGDARLYEPLLALQERWGEQEMMLEDAIAACTPQAEGKPNCNDNG